MYRACHQNGLVGDDLGPIMRNLNGLIEAGAGISWSPGGFIAVHQNIELFDQRTASNTQNAFWAYVEAGNSPLFLGDEGVYPPSGGTVSLLKGYVTLAVPAGAVSTQTPFRLTYLSSYGGVTQTLLTDDDRGMDQRFVLMPKTETLVRGSYMTFASPVLLSVKHKASSIVAGQNEANLRILHQTANGMPAVVVAGSQSDVAHHIVSAPITEDGVYFVGWP
jgi:hypothetical protein